MSQDPPHNTVELDRYRPYLRVLAHGRMGQKYAGKIDSSDLVQLTLLKAHDRLSGFRGESEGELLAWLRKILANTVIDELRRFEGGRRNLALERSLQLDLDQTSTHLATVLAADQETPSQVIIRQEQLTQMWDAIDRLPEEQKHAVILMHLRGKPVRAVAEEMGKTEAAVGGLLRRGMRNLREMMDGG